MLYTIPASPVVKFQQPRLGQVQETITPNQLGWVKFGGSYWAAKFYEPDFSGSIVPGEQVTVLGHQGNALLVMPKDYVEPHRRWNWWSLWTVAA
jgi:membrane-bound ClpP family serine protease